MKFYYTLNNICQLDSLEVLLEALRVFHLPDAMKRITGRRKDDKFALLTYFGDTFLLA